MATATFGVSLLLELQDKLSAPLSKVTNMVQKVGDSVSAAATKMQKFGEKVNNAGKDVGKVGKDLSMKLTLPIAAIGAAAVKSSIDFNKGMANIATLIPGNTKRVDELGKAILKMSEDTGASSADLSDGMYQVISAFGDSKDAVSQLAVANKAAKAGLSTTTEAVNLLTAVTKGYNDTSAAAVQKASDLAFVTVKLGQTTFPELADSMGRAVPMAKSLNTSQEELFATFATLTGVTGKASEVSSQMRGVMTSLLKPTEDMQQVMTSLGFTSGDMMVKQLGLVGTMQKLADAVGNDQAKMAAMFGNVEGLTAALSLTGAQAETFKRKFAEMNKAAGATNQAFKDQTTGVGAAGFSMQRMIETVKSMAINLGQQLLPYVQKIASAFMSVLEYVNALPAPMKDLIIVMAGILAAVGPILTVVSAFKKLQVIMSTLKANPIILIATSVLALAAAFKGARTDVATLQQSVDSYREANERASKNDELLKSMNTAGQGTDEYQKKLQELLAANPKLANANINLKSSYDEVSKAVSRLNEQEKIRAKAKALDEYKAGLNTLGDLTKNLAFAEMNLKATDPLSEGYAEAKIKYDNAKLEFEDMQNTLRNAGTVAGIGSEKVTRDVRRAAKATILGGLELESKTADQSVAASEATAIAGGESKPFMYMTNMLQGILQKPPVNPVLEGIVKVVVEGTGTATAGFNNGNVKTEVTSTGLTGRTRNL